MSSETNFVTHFIAGGVGGACDVVVGHPFDTVKVRMQTLKQKPGEKPRYAGTFDCFRKTIGKEGFFALYKGMGAPLIAVTPQFALYFGGCAIGRWLQKKHPDDKLSTLQMFNTGALAGVFMTVVMAPGERVKCLLQVQRSHSANKMKHGTQYSGPADVVKELYNEGGLRSIYRGFGATLLRNVPAAGVYLATYDWMKRRLTRNLNANRSSSLNPFQTMLAGGIAGAANWCVCIPVDALKSRLQTAPEGKYPDGIRGVFRQVMREEGPRALFRGFLPGLLRAFPGNAACFLGLEMTLKLFRSIGF